MNKRHSPTTPRLFVSLFENWRLSWIWLIVRIYVGYQWISAGLEKITDPSWVGADAGTALQSFVSHAVTLTKGAHPAVQGWYAGFLQAVILPIVNIWSYVVAFGETLVGIALILGIFTGVAAFFGAFMNFNYLMAGSISSNPYLLILEFLLILAWKIAGFLGLDLWLLYFQNFLRKKGKIEKI